MTTRSLRRPYSMIRDFHLADWFTLANAVCGTGALFSMLTYLQTADVRHVYFACGMVVAALVFDLPAYVVACGVSRLARYAITAEAPTGEGDKVMYFEGTPSRPRGCWW